MTVEELMRFPQAEWRPTADNPGFLGVSRWNILRKENDVRVECGWMRSVRLLVLATAAAVGLSQSEGDPYFALSSSRTFGTDGKPSVSLTAWNVDSLAFRVYRIKDPGEVLRATGGCRTNSADARRGRAHERTLLERIHMWKHGLRAADPEIAARAVHGIAQRALRKRLV